MKTLKIGLLALVVLVGLFLLVLVFWGGHVVKHGVEQVGPRVLGVPVTLDQARFQPFRGQVHLSGLVIGNPEGFRTENLFAMQNLEVDLDVRSLFSDEIVVRRILVESPRITYEVGLRRTNLGTLVESLESKSDRPEAVEHPAEKVPARKVIIKELILADAQMHVSATVMGGRSAPIRLSTIHLTELGGEDQSIIQITTQVMQAILAAAGHAVIDADELLGDGLKSALQGVGIVTGAATEGARAAAGVAVEGARTVTGAAADGSRAAADAVGDRVRGLRDRLRRSDEAVPEGDAEPAPTPPHPAIEPVHD